MKGNRTIIFNLVMAVVGLAGFKLSPDTVNTWLDVFIPAWAIGGLLLRQLTNTPIFQKEAAALGVPAEFLDTVRQAVATSVPTDAVQNLNDALARIAGHPLADPATVSMLSDALAKMSQANGPVSLVTALGAEPGDSVFLDAVNGVGKLIKGGAAALDLAPQSDPQLQPAPAPAPQPVPQPVPEPAPQPVAQPVPQPTSVAQ